MAQQATGSVLIGIGDSVVLATATVSDPREGIDFFPLTVDFEERLYARGKIPGSFFRREGRPSTHGVLIARLIDRPIRPLFPEGFKNEVQVVLTPLSVDDDVPIDIVSLIGASAALSISGIPFEGPIGATRIGYVNGEFIVNPSYEEMGESKLDIVVAGSRDGVIMMEAGSSELPEDVVFEAIKKAQSVNEEVIDFQDEIIKAVGKPTIEYPDNTPPDGIAQRVLELSGDRLEEAFSKSTGKSDFNITVAGISDDVNNSLGEDFEKAQVESAFDSVLEKTFKKLVLSGGPRPDGRGPKEIRPIECDVSILPRTHGTGLFTRGETQILGVATLGSVGDAQRMDTLAPDETKTFMLHYNFPPYSVGEARFMRGPGRRELGHGALAERALEPVLPSQEEFPYTLRLVCEALSSNGSTSMGSVCAGTLALLDAGVKIKSPVAGISIGLIVGDDGEFVTLTDIQGLEDHVGDMDFKVAGTSDGITAIQLDIKAKHITFPMIERALDQAKEGRLEILGKISETISDARSEMSPFAPRMIRISVPVEKIGLVIGPGGKTIRGIVEETGATVDVGDDGAIIIGSPDGSAADKAIAMIEDLTKEILVGDIYTGKVVRLMNFGAFVQILPGKDGLVHISQLSDRRVESVESEVEVGQQLTVVVTQVDDQGRINLSRRALLDDEDDRTLEEKIESGDFIPVRPQRNRNDRSGRGPRSGDRGGRGGRNNRGGDRGGDRGRGGLRPRD